MHGPIIQNKSIDLHCSSTEWEPYHQYDNIKWVITFFRIIEEVLNKGKNKIIQLKIFVQDIYDIDESDWISEYVVLIYLYVALFI